MSHIRMQENMFPSSNENKRNNLAPSRSTVYVSNLPFSLTNTDLHKIFEKFGKLVRITILREKGSHKSRGVAFLMYLTKDEAQACVRGTNNCQMFGRTLKASIAKDNGRAPEFIRRREYPDKTRCYECGECGHLSYSCPKNLLGPREPPKKKAKRKKRDEENEDCCTIDDNDKESDDSDGNVTFDDESLSAAIRYQQELREAEEFQSRVNSGEYSAPKHEEVQRSRITQSSYFSDEEEEDEAVDT